MPWSAERDPVSMKSLAARARRKAIGIGIANPLLEEGYDEDRCIRIANSRAKRWGAACAAGRSSWLLSRL